MCSSIRSTSCLSVCARPVELEKAKDAAKMQEGSGGGGSSSKMTVLVSLKRRPPPAAKLLEMASICRWSHSRN